MEKLWKQVPNTCLRIISPEEQESWGIYPLSHGWVLFLVGNVKCLASPAFLVGIEWPPVQVKALGHRSTGACCGKVSGHTNMCKVWGLKWGTGSICHSEGQASISNVKARRLERAWCVESKRTRKAFEAKISRGRIRHNWMNGRQVRLWGLFSALLHTLDGLYSVVLLDWVEDRRGGA